MLFFLQMTSSNLLNQFLLGITFAFIIVFFSYRLKFLTLSGSIATFVLAGIIFSLGGIKWSVPILTFFIPSSLLSKFRKEKNQDVELFFEKSNTRDHFQVLANGGIGGFLVLLNFFYPDKYFYLMYLASLSAVCSDTWATEIGTWKKNKTYNITTLKPTEQGVSGGISLLGSFGALVGTIVIAISGICWINLNYNFYFALIIVSGLTGSFVDSILGATVQLKNKCIVCGKITERHFHCEKQTTFYKGLNWINNDVVNFFAAFSGSVVIFILLIIKNF